MAKPRLLFFFNGLPEYEALFAIARRLLERGKVEPVCLSPSEALRREPRLKPMIAASGLGVTARPSRWIKLFPKRWLRKGDAAITMVDPTMDNSPTRPRSLAMLDLGMPTIFVQHGVMQGKLNLASDPRDIHYASRLLLTFEDLIIPEILSEETRRKVRKVGFIKPLLFSPRPPMGALPDHDRAILFCHSFRWAGRYGEEDVARFYDLVDRFARNRPDALIIIRSHRGKSRALYKAHDRALSELPNVVFSHAYKGPLRGMSMTDVLGLVDMCVSTASTAVLDSVYMGKPTAIYENDQPVFSELPNIDGLESLEAFFDAPEAADIAAVHAHYGDVGESIERACTAIEKAMQNMTRSGSPPSARSGWARTRGSVAHIR